MNRDPNKKHTPTARLDYCEYINSVGETKSCLECLCSCDALDTAGEQLCRGDFSIADEYCIAACADVDDRLRIPWRGGAMKLNSHAVSVMAMFSLFLVVGSVNLACLVITGSITLLVCVRMFKYLTKRTIKSIYFFVLSLLHIFTVIVLYSIKIFPVADPVHVYYFYFWVIIYLSVLYAFKQDPGYISQELRAEEKKELRHHVLFCEMCSIVRPVRAWHCKFCTQCVNKYDHHNVWYDQCVGARNHLSFIVLLVALANLSFSAAWDFLLHSCTVNILWHHLEVPDCREFVVGNGSSSVFLMAVFSLVVLLCTLYQLVLQLKCISFNLTGFEARCLQRGYPIHDPLLREHYYHSPYHTTVADNWVSFCAPSHDKELETLDHV